MKSAIDLALWRVHCASQILYDASKENPVGLEEYQTMAACLVQLSHCCTVLAAKVEHKLGVQIEVDEVMMAPGALPAQYKEIIDAAVRDSYGGK